MVVQRRRLGEMLVAAGELTEEQLQKALNVQQGTRDRLGKVLVNLGFLTERSIVKVLKDQLGLEMFDFTADKPQREALAVLPANVAERYGIIPVRREPHKLVVAMGDPTNFYALDDVRIITGLEVEAVLAAEQDILRSITQYYGVNEALEKALSQLKPEEKTVNTDIQVADDAPIISIMNAVISQAIKERASDIHVEPQDNRVRVRYRVDGVLREAFEFPKSSQAAILSRIKIMAEMDIAERRLPQDGRIKVREEGREIDLRVSTLPTILGEKAVLRILDKKGAVKELDSLGLREDNLARYQRLIRRPYGMILVTGPTGSGKTTTLYSTLQHISTPECNIITVEDPVEYRLEGVNQVQVNTKAGLTFASGLRSILRQDPNVILVGEIRDNETADIAIRAALTGHLVFSTLHTNDAVGAIARLTDMDVEPFLVSSSLLGIVAQRLVRLICSDCKTSYTPEVDSPERVFLGANRDADLVLYKRGGCGQCNGTGYRGRMAIHEVLCISSDIREAINRRLPSHEIAVMARQAGMDRMHEDGIAKVIAGLTTVEEVMRVEYADQN